MKGHRVEEFNIEQWQPKSSLGKQVKEGKITDVSQILRIGKPIKEKEIVDALVPNIQEEILEVTLVQRMHKSGRRVKYRVVAVVGNKDGIVGVGHASARDVSSSIQKAVNVAKLNVIEVTRGCGSWECGCGRSHSIPFEVSGRCGSVKVFIKPAPRGLGLASAEIPKAILRMAGILDAWTRSEGQTRTTLNFAMAVMDALKHTTRVVMGEKYRERVVVGRVGVTSG
ncbi:MAG: 30S ribosomal protein S5 [Candidatus Hadarchaeaceae archaeon]